MHCTDSSIREARIQFHLPPWYAPGPSQMRTRSHQSANLCSFAGSLREKGGWHPHFLRVLARASTCSPPSAHKNQPAIWKKAKAARRSSPNLSHESHFSTTIHDLLRAGILQAGRHGNKTPRPRHAMHLCFRAMSTSLARSRQLPSPISEDDTIPSLELLLGGSDCVFPLLPEVLAVYDPVNAIITEVSVDSLNPGM